MNDEEARRRIAKIARPTAAPCAGRDHKKTILPDSAPEGHKALAHQAFMVIWHKALPRADDAGRTLRNQDSLHMDNHAGDTTLIISISKS